SGIGLIDIDGMNVKMRARAENHFEIAILAFDFRATGCIKDKRLGPGRGNAHQENQETIFRNGICRQPTERHNGMNESGMRILPGSRAHQLSVITH
ncbi:MAG TPA: hypothetical protein VLD19_00720, partial [Chitinophagaceae bacterium]|nr:hypothetical protein [Chitinophagaceae bacterium]